MFHLLYQRPVGAGPDQTPADAGSILDNQGKHALVAQVDDFTWVAACSAVDGAQGQSGEQLRRTRPVAGMPDPEVDHVAGPSGAAVRYA